MCGGDFLEYAPVFGFEAVALSFFHEYYFSALVFPFLPLQEWFRITWLPQLSDYLLIGGMVAIWAFVLRLIWRTAWTKPFVESPSLPRQVGKLEVE